jgi:HlyD family secretion protein
MRERVTGYIRARPAWVIGGVLVALVVGVMFYTASRPAKEATSYYEVRRGDFLISVVEGGSIEALREVVVRNQVEGTSRIIYIVPEGTYVREGDLIVELDSAGAQDALNQQLINFEKSQFALTQAREQLAIQRSVVESEVRAAELKVEFADLDLKRYLRGEALQNRRQAEIELTSIEENLKINEERFKWSEQLHEQGFETKSNLDRDRLAVLQSHLNLERATTNLWMIEAFDHPKRQRQLEAALDEARKDLDRVILQGQRRLAQYEADVRTQETTLELNRTKLERDQRQLEATKVTAPQDGLVVYPVSGNRFSSESLIEEGATVRNRQELIKLPDIDAMKLSIRVHESQINMVRVGQPAFVVLDSMPDTRFQGRVSRVGLLPDTQARWANPNLKVYVTEVLVTDQLPDVKPGVSARAEIVITNLQNVITVPIQAVTTQRGEPVVFVAQGRSAAAVPVEVGLYNTKFIQILSGLEEGDRVLLAPPFDTEERDLSGAILAGAEGETLTNLNLAIVPPVGQERVPGAGMVTPEVTVPTGMVEGNGGGAVVAGGLEGGGRPAGAGRGNREEMMKRFDTNRDGELDDAERAAMREALGAMGGGTSSGRGERAGRQGGGVEGGARALPRED